MAKPTSVTWSPIRERNLYGYEATVGDRTAEVVRAWTGDWRIMSKIAGAVCKLTPELDGDGQMMSYPRARTNATRFLRGEITPEIW